MIATGGDVIVTFVSDGAGFTSDLFLDGPIGDELGAIFNNSTTAVGATVNLGSFEQGQELVFKLLVQQTGDVFYTGDGGRNLDGVVHAEMQSASDQVLVGFEDLLNGGDFDYNDLVFAFTNVRGVPDPGDGTSVVPGSSGSAGSGSAGGAGSDGSTPPAAGALQGVGGRDNSLAAPPLAVDEPSTLLMLGTGLLVVGAAMRRQSLGR